jgi:hypothetical protein
VCGDDRDGGRIRQTFSERAKRPGVSFAFEREHRRRVCDEESGRSGPFHGGHLGLTLRPEEAKSFRRTARLLRTSQQMRRKELAAEEAHITDF